MRKGSLEVKAIGRNEQDYTRERRQDIPKTFRSTDPALHPFAQAREYTRALNATKWERMFAKPFLFAFDQHQDAITSIANLPTKLSHILSGSADGEIKFFNLVNRKCEWSAKAHRGFVKDLCSDQFGTYFLSCGIDQTIKLWKPNPFDEEDEEDESLKSEAKEGEVTPLSTYLSTHAFSSITHHRKNDLFASAGKVVELWSPERSEPLHSFNFNVDSVHSVRFNLVETDVLLASAFSERSLMLFDVRSKTPIRKLVMRMSTNALCWNPQEAFVFTTANEDKNLYTFDMRHLEKALTVHQDHVSAVMSIDYCPTGKQFVSGSYDRTLRIFNADEGHSKEIYHAKRMGRVFVTKFTGDSKYIISGSDDSNLRVWKTKASEKLATLLPREQAALDYNERLKEKFAHAPEIKRIARHRQVPTNIKKAKEMIHEIKQSTKEKEKRRRAHSKPGAVPFQNAKKTSIVKEKE